MGQEARARTGAPLDGVQVAAVAASEMGEAVAVLARGMRDNPLHVAVYGDDPERRRRATQAAFGGVAAPLGWQRHMLVARDAGGAIVGVCGMAPPGSCQPTPSQRLRLLPLMLRNGPRTAARTLRWLGAWARHDPEERHWHLGPLGVDAPLQGQGVGSRLMRAFCAQMDAAGDAAYLETDKPINVRFYERFGFEVVGEQDVLGVPNWFMLRQPARPEV